MFSSNASRGMATFASPAPLRHDGVLDINRLSYHGTALSLMPKARSYCFD